MESAMALRSAEPWYADARAALEDEQSGEVRDDDALSTLVMREFPFYFARYGATEQAYVSVLATEPVNADALGLFNSEIMATFDLRSELARITARTFVITGNRTLSQGRRVRRRSLRGSRGRGW